MTSFEDALAAEIRAVQSTHDDADRISARLAEDRATAIAARREAISAFVRHMGSAGSPGLMTVDLLRRASAARTPHHRRFRRVRPSDSATWRQQEDAYLVAHWSDVPLGGSVNVLLPFWVLTDGTVVWAAGSGHSHEVDLRDIVPLHEDVARSLNRAWAVAVAMDGGPSQNGSTPDAG